MRDNLEKDVKNLKADWSKCTGVEATARKNDKDASKYLIMSHEEVHTLKSHKIRKSCCDSSSSQANDARRLMARGIVVFNEIKTIYMRMSLRKFLMRRWI